MKEQNIDEATGLDITPLIEWAQPNEVAAQAALNTGDEPRSDEYDGAILVQPVDDLNETFEVVRGGEGIDEGETLSTAQITTLREMGKTVIEQSLLEATYHVHAEVSPRGIPLSHNHRIPINAKSEAEAKSKARKHAKERGWKIHNINRVTLAEGKSDTLKFAPNLTEDDLSFVLENIALEELEQLDELSTEKLKAYVKKAKPEYEDAWLQMKNKLAKKRGQGIDRAEDKLRMKKIVREIVETGELEDQAKGPTKFSEITAPTLHEMFNLPTHKLEALVKRGETDEKGMSPAFGNQVKRARQELARRKAAKSKYAKTFNLKEEEALPLDESWGLKVHDFEHFKRAAEDYADNTTTRGKYDLHTRKVTAGGKTWHQTSAVVNHMRRGPLNIGHFNHTGKGKSHEGHGQILQYWGDEDDD